MSETAETTQTEAPGGRWRSIRRRLWSPKTRVAMVIAAPSLLGSICAFTLEASESVVPGLKTQREALERDAFAFESLAKDFEAYELQRASVLINLAAANAPMESRYAIDTLYRLKAETALRRFLHDRPKPELDGLAGDYGNAVHDTSQERDRIDRLQQLEDKIIVGALVGKREAQNAILDASAEIDKRERWNTLLGDLIKYIGYVGSIIAFFARSENQTS